MTEVVLDKQADIDRTWAMGAHLCALISLMAPMGGLIGTIVIYSMHRSDVPYVRENARNALNAQITITIVALIGFAIYLVLFAALFFSVPFASSHQHANPPPPRFFYEFGGVFLVGIGIMLIVLASSIWHAFGARAAYLGKIYRYPWAIAFVK